jgi:hypothetical protein
MKSWSVLHRTDASAHRQLSIELLAAILRGRGSNASIAFRALVAHVIDPAGVLLDFAQMDAPPGASGAE